MIKNPLVIGHKGEIGIFILNGLLRTMPKATNILCFDVNETEKEKIDRIKKSDVIFLCVPIQDTVNWLLRYGKYLKGKIVIEQTSLKSWLNNKKNFKFVEGCKGPLIMSMHILFRPSITFNKEDRKVILVDKGSWQFRSNELCSLIQAITGSNIIYVKDIKTHDIIMAYQQALVHRILLTLDEVLISRDCQTYIGKQLEVLIKRIKSGDQKLYSLIQNNLYLDKALGAFKKSLTKFRISNYFMS